MVIENSAEAMFASVASVLSQDGLAELIIIDNGNAPDVISRLQQRSLSDPRITIISGHGGIGYGAGCNIGARLANSEILTFLKPNYLLPPDALKDLCKTLQSEPKAMLTSGVIKLADGRIGYKFRNKIITPKSVFYEIIGIKKHDISPSVSAKNPYEVATISSACLCVRASDYRKLGGLDNDFYPQSEEADFCLRVQQIGGRVMCIPTVNLTFMPDILARKNNLALQWQLAKNKIRYLNKFFAGHQLFGTLFLLNVIIILHAILNIVWNFIRKKNCKPNTVTPAEKRLMALALGLVDAVKSEQLAKKIVLVTGATSPVGLCVVRRLIAAGAAVLAVSRNDEIPYYHPSLRWIKGDLSASDFGLQDYCVDFVIHAAPLPLLPPLIDLLSNAEAKRIIAYSSTSVFAKLLSTNDFERDFAVKLQAAEELIAKKCDERGVFYTIFRPTLSYGLGLDAGISKLASVIRKWGRVCVYPPAFGRRQPVHADDLAAAAILALENENTYGKSYNLSGGEIVTYHNMLARIFEIYGKKPKIISSTMLPFALDILGKLRKNKYMNGEIARRMNDDLVFFHDDAKRDFGFNPRAFLSSGIKDIQGF